MTTLLSMPPPSEVEKKCPHVDIRFCPLYHASHETTGLGCDDGKATGWDGCGVARAYDYGTLLAKLIGAAPQMVAMLAFEESAESSKAQRNLNMKNNGLH